MAVMAELKEHPIMITLQDAISGNGFLAGITISGRALMRLEEGGEWWMYGVRPAAIAESGATVEEAFLHFRNRYKETLLDIAQEATDFETFKTEVERFFNEEDADNEDARSWEAALNAIRNENLAPPDAFAKLKRESPENKPSQVSVERLDRKDKHFMPSDNVNDRYSLARAA
jgi:hypothetical protein